MQPVSLVKLALLINSHIWWSSAACVDNKIPTNCTCTNVLGKMKTSDQTSVTCEASGNEETLEKNVDTILKTVSKQDLLSLEIKTDINDVTHLSAFQPDAFNHSKATFLVLDGLKLDLLFPPASNDMLSGMTALYINGLQKNLRSLEIRNSPTIYGLDWKTLAESENKLLNLQNLVIEDSNLYILKHDLMRIGYPKRVSFKRTELRWIEYEALYGLCLEWLNLAENYIKKLELRHFHSEQAWDSLKYLDLSKNKLQDMDSEVFKLFTNLKELHLEGNELKVIDVNSLINWINMTELWISDNPLKCSSNCDLLEKRSGSEGPRFWNIATCGMTSQNVPNTNIAQEKVMGKITDSYFTSICSSANP